MDRRIWASLLYFENTFWFSLNEEISGEPNLLFLLKKTKKENLFEFLKRAKNFSKTRVNIEIKHIFVLIDFDQKESLKIETSQKLQSNYKLLSSNLDSNFFIKIKQSFLEKLVLASNQNKIEIVALEFSSKVLALYLKRKLNSDSLWILHSQNSLLKLLNFKKGALQNLQEIEFEWEKILKKLQKSFFVSRTQIELFLFSGFELDSKNNQNLHPQIKSSSCSWHLKRDLKTHFEKLKTQVFQEEPVVVLGLLKRIRGIEKFVEKSFFKLKVVSQEKTSLFCESIHLHNRAFNYYLWDKKLLGDFTYNTGDFEVKISKSTKLFESFQKFIKILFRNYQKQIN